MNPQTILNTCTQAGVMLTWDGRNIKARGEQQTLSRLLPILRTHKAELRAYFAADATDFYEERAASLEYDAGLSRSDAEAQAFTELQAWQTNRTYH